MAADTFPLPRDDNGLPNWAWGVVGACIAVTILWLIALVFVVVWEIVSGKPKRPASPPVTFERALSHPPSPVPSPHSSSNSSESPQHEAPTHAASSAYMMDEKPPIPTRRDADLLGVDGGDPFENTPDYRLSVLKSSSSESSLSSSASVEPGNEEKVRPKQFTHGSLDSDDSSNGASRRSTPTSLSGMVLSRPVTVRQLGATIREPGYIEAEFRKLPNPVVNAEDIPVGAERKNRYSNVLPSPKTRVQLKLQHGRPHSDYINANYVRGFKNTPQQYIATQGPMENTVGDFWRMVWENNCDIIVMATNFQERGIDKCWRYWPAQGSEEYEALEVSTHQQSTQDNYISTKLSLRNLETGESRAISHYRLTCWPNQGVPKTTKPITDFLKDVKMADSIGPVVVHCSAGIGRTAVLIAVDIGVQGVMQGEAKTDILRIVSTLRQDRAGAVQTRDQYRFIHQALYDFAKEASAQ